MEEIKKKETVKIINPSKEVLGIKKNIAENTMMPEEGVGESTKIVDFVVPRGEKDFKKNIRKSPRREARIQVKPEFDNKLLEIRRVARVVSGGRRFSFSASLVVGDRKGRVGVGVGKATDTPIAIEKALRDGKKNIFSIPLSKQSSILHAVDAKYGASHVMLAPAPGKRIVAGSSVRVVLELAGITAVGTKILSRSKNKINNARAAIKALMKLKEVKMETSKN